MRYSAKFKDRMVRQLVGPTAKSALELSKDVGVSQSTLSRWLRASIPAVANEENEPVAPIRKTRERTPLEKAELVIEAGKLEGEALGALLRRNGIHEADLDEWRTWLRERLDPAATRREARADSKSKQADQKRIKNLERELRRKEKALAEAAALLVLQKKLKDLWGDEDDDTDSKNGA